jgi:hypothetical protein
MTFDQLQEQGGIGAGDLEATLAVMIDDGSVVRTPEDTYAFVPEEDRGVRASDPDAVPVEALEPGDPDRVEAEARAAELARPAPGGGRSGAVGQMQVPPPGVTAERPAHVELVGGPVIRLTKGMIGAMSDEALGSVIKAAAEEHTGDDELTIAIA